MKKFLLAIVAGMVGLAMVGAPISPAYADVTSPNGVVYKDLVISSYTNGDIVVCNPGSNPGGASVSTPAPDDEVFIAPGETQVYHVAAPSQYDAVWVSFYEGEDTFPGGIKPLAYDLSPGTPPALCPGVDPEPTVVTPTKPTQAGNVVTIPSVAGVTYLVSGAPVTGQYVLTQTSIVTAQPNQGYAFPAGTVTSWSFVYTPPRVTVTSATLKFVKLPTSRKPGKVVLTLKSATGAPVSGKAILYVKRDGVTKKVAATVSGTNTVIRVPKLKKGVWKFQAKFLGNTRFTAKNTKIYKVRIRR